MKTIISILVVGILLVSCKKDRLYLDGKKAWPDSTLVEYNGGGNSIVAQNGISIKEPLTVVSSDHTALYDGWQYTCHDSNIPHLYWVIAYTNLERY